MDAGYEDAMAVMPQILERVSERWSPRRYAERREEFAKCPPLVFNDYKLEGLSSAPEAYIRDFVKVDRRTPGRQRPMGFSELRDNLYAVLADGDFTMDFPHVTYDTVTERYSFRQSSIPNPTSRSRSAATSPRRPSTRPTSASITRRSAVWGSSWAPTSISGRSIRGGTIGGRTDFYMWKPVFLDYSYNFAVRNFRHGSFGNITKIDNTGRSRTAKVSSRWPPECPSPTAASS